jgi:hypothetical protein
VVQSSPISSETEGGEHSGPHCRAHWPRTRHWALGQDDQGRTVVSDRGRPQTAWPIRGLWFIVIGWWASALWMGLAWLIQLTVIGIPIALLMFNRTPFIASLYRY